MPAQFFQVFTFISDIAIIIFAAYYFFKFRSKVKELDRRERKVDTEYHQVVDTALSRERKIVDDAVKEANEIIVDTQYLSDTTKKEVDQVLAKTVADIQKDALTTAQHFAQSYHTALQQSANQSLQDFHTVAAGMEIEMQKLIRQFHEALLPQMQKELEDYKQARLKQTDEMVTKVVSTVAQEVLNKSIPLADHKDLIIKSLEKAKKAGVFE